MFSEATQRRFWAKVVKTESCWLWTGAKCGPTNRKLRYGNVSINKKNYGAHRVAYIITKGMPADGLVLDHLCRNTLCVNPDHLEPVTNRENILRGEAVSAVAARMEVCKYGHPLTEDNVKFRQGKGDRPARRCLTCHLSANKKQRPQDQMERRAAYNRERNRRQREARMAQTG